MKTGSQDITWLAIQLRAQKTTGHVKTVVRQIEKRRSSYRFGRNETDEKAA